MVKNRAQHLIWLYNVTKIEVNSSHFIEYFSKFREELVLKTQLCVLINYT